MVGATPQAQTFYDTDTFWTDLGNGWIEVKAPLSGFGSLANATDIILIVKDDATNPVYFTDIYIK